MKFVELLIFCICLIGISHAQMDLYFEPEESSGDGATHTVNPDLPIDDEDTDDDEGSGFIPIDDDQATTTTFIETHPTTMSSTVITETIAPVFAEEGEIHSMTSTEIPKLHEVSSILTDSGAPIPTSENDDDADIEEIDVGEEPEVNGEKAKTPIKVHELPKDLNKGTKGVGTKGVLAEEDEPEQKNVKTTELEDEEMEPVGASPTKDPSFLGAIIAGACIGLLFAICVIMLLVYRMRKKDEGSYALEYGVDGKKPQGNYEYTKGVAGGKEYFA
ncbi:uncharacterized protein LOC120331218 isoform X1 [Styela clava]|uniref:syndecan-2-like isoform X1 n=1 Tax=Styela clava TaxID=7725 RepID=UPI001939EA97|nr:syndecan-2-like isoform X1 [Styela clava]